MSSIRRKRQSAAQVNDKRIYVYVADFERERLEKAAGIANVSVSALLSKAGLELADSILKAHQIGTEKL